MLAVLLDQQKALSGLCAALGMIVAMSFVVATGVLTRCPYCGWILLLRFSPEGFHGRGHPWVDKVCSHCKHDLTMPPEEPSPR